MSTLTIKLIDMIHKGWTLNDISSELGLSNKQIYNILRGLKLKGFDFDRKYYYSGDVVYVPRTDICPRSENNCVNLLTSHNDSVFRAMLISDLHAGSDCDCIFAWHQIYDYCVCNNINIIIIAGDFLDGINIGRKDCKKHCTALEQIEYAISNYPSHKNILNFALLGNHDIDSLLSYGIDFSTYLNNFRHDIIPIGYGSGRINIKNDKILVTHPLCIGVDKNLDLSGNYLLIKGHHHNARAIISGNGNCSVNVPSLSNIFLSDNVFLPGAMVLTAKFKDGYFDTVCIEQLLIKDRIYAINSLQYSITSSKDRRFDGVIKNEEEIKRRILLKK